MLHRQHSIAPGPQCKLLGSKFWFSIDSQDRPILESFGFEPQRKPIMWIPIWQRVLIPVPSQQCTLCMPFNHVIKAHSNRPNVSNVQWNQSWVKSRAIQRDAWLDLGGGSLIVFDNVGIGCLCKSYKGSYFLSCGVLVLVWGQFWEHMILVLVQYWSGFERCLQ